MGSSGGFGLGLSLKLALLLILWTAVWRTAADPTSYATYVSILEENLKTETGRNKPLPSPLYEDEMKCDSGNPADPAGGKPFFPITPEEIAQASKLTNAALGNRCKSGICNFRLLPSEAQFVCMGTAPPVSAPVTTPAPKPTVPPAGSGAFLVEVPSVSGLLLATLSLALLPFSSLF